MEIKGDFLGFTFNGESTTSLGITRVSDGDRYKDQLVPEIEDKTVEIPGLDGAYFYGTNFKPKNFSLSVAFDDVSEEQLRKMKQLFGFRHIGDLIFDEWPYKRYLVKVASPPEFEYVCFDERQKEVDEEGRDGVRIIRRSYAGDYSFPLTVPHGVISEHTIEDKPDSIDVLVDDESWSTDYWDYDSETGVIEFYATELEEDVDVVVTYTIAEDEIEREKVYPYTYSDEVERRYKGEGTIEFVAYYPFAKIVNKYLDDYDDENKDEWSIVSGLKDSTWYVTNNIDTCVNNVIKVYNPGDIETGFKLYIPFNSNTISAFTLEYNDQILAIKEITKKGEDTWVRINTINGLVEGISDVTAENEEGAITGNTYNECAMGEFFKIQSNSAGLTQEISISAAGHGNDKIFYDYLYF